MHKIYLSPSDQDRNTYAYGGTTENVQCGIIANFCAEALKRCGFEVKCNTTDEMEDRVRESNAWGADVHIPIHSNAFNGSVGGTRIFSYDKTNAGSKIARAIYDVLAPITPGTSDNIGVNTSWYEMRVPDASSVYIECEFHDVPDIAKWIIENTKLIGETIARGICNHYGVTFVEEPQFLYKVQVGAFGVKDNADKMLAKLRASGFDGFIIKVNK